MTQRAGGKHETSGKRSARSDSVSGSAMLQARPKHHADDPETVAVRWATERQGHCHRSDSSLLSLAADRGRAIAWAGAFRLTGFGSRGRPGLRVRGSNRCKGWLDHAAGRRRRRLRRGFRILLRCGDRIGVPRLASLTCYERRRGYEHEPSCQSHVLPPRAFKYSRTFSAELPTAATAARSSVSVQPSDLHQSRTS